MQTCFRKIATLNSIFIVVLCIVNTSQAQSLKLNYFHVNGNIFTMPDNNSVVGFINSYNTLALKPTPDYTLKIMPGLAGTLLAGFSYKGSRNVVTIPLFFGQSLISSDRSDAPKSPDWKTLNFSYFGTGIGYLGYVFTKALGKSYRFPKLEYQVSLNAESDSFLYKDESGKNDKQIFFLPPQQSFFNIIFTLRRKSRKDASVLV